MEHPRKKRVRHSWISICILRHKVGSERGLGGALMGMERAGASA